jgi:hypothetical protein
VTFVALLQTASAVKDLHVNVGLGLPSPAIRRPTTSSALITSAKWREWRRPPPTSCAPCAARERCASLLAVHSVVQLTERQRTYHDMAMLPGQKAVVGSGPPGYSAVSGHVVTVFGCTGFLGRYLVSKLGASSGRLYPKVIHTHYMRGQPSSARRSSFPTATRTRSAI